VLVAMLALNGKEAEARGTLKHYLSRNDSKMRSVSAVSAQLSSQAFSPLSLAFVQRVSEGMRRVGMPEE
jgi:hypothetical protein